MLKNPSPATATGWALLLSFGASSAYAQTAQEIARRAFGSTVLLVTEDSNGQPLSLGSGFIVRGGAVASNLHVVEGAARGYAKLIGEETKASVRLIQSGIWWSSRSRPDARRRFLLVTATRFRWASLSMLWGTRRDWKALSHKASSAASEMLGPTNSSRSQPRSRPAVAEVQF